MNAEIQFASIPNKIIIPTKSEQKYILFLLEKLSSMNNFTNFAENMIQYGKK